MNNNLHKERMEAEVFLCSLEEEYKNSGNVIRDKKVDTLSLMQSCRERLRQIDLQIQHENN